MVTATRRRTFSSTQITTEPSVEVQEETSGKRKSGPARSATTDTQRNKRRKRASLESTQETENDPQNETVEMAGQSEAETDAKALAHTKSNHFRFDDEEPELQLNLEAGEQKESFQEKEGDDDDSSDDDAPEVIDNSAQLSKIKSEARKLETTQKREEQKKREKRKKLDDLRKQQAKTSHKRKENPSDDLPSESTETLQGSTTHDVRRSALPALLPDDILNSVPVTRPLTLPVEEADTIHKKPKKLKFLDKAEKRPKDVKVGDVTIRILDRDTSQKKPKTSLPPKASRAGRNSKENWLKQARSTGSVNGLRRTKGSSSGFVRR
ncbi:hypothetical protein EYZ11_005033 [Aspergillus tanneri]|uniref:Immediate-early protein n=1 Tax=Aspergillus tanneri TaxID=1220188 RepID=A0A4S3JLC5_9EURO|nr:uncharacterized protein ATNIH1004_003420 [Aspergillus tanneri]KAA8650732.1 hypothetical protein ATNIH1004_003420 [Aspergillus tanneri]THC95478.1 hypothetical protein EYZ11_005033 [Aspergillus tanneri]